MFGVQFIFIICKTLKNKRVVFLRRDYPESGTMGMNLSRMPAPQTLIINLNQLYYLLNLNAMLIFLLTFLNIWIPCRNGDFVVTLDSKIMINGSKNE